MPKNDKFGLPYKARSEPPKPSTKARYTSMSRQRFHEIRHAWMNGDLLAKWEELQKPDAVLTHADEVEERQIRCIALALTGLPDLQRNQLIDENNKKWREIVFLRDFYGNFSVEVY